MRPLRVPRCIFDHGIAVSSLLAFLSRAKEHARARKGARPRPQRSMRAFLWVSKEAQMTHGRRRSSRARRKWVPGPQGRASGPPLGPSSCAQMFKNNKTNREEAPPLISIHLRFLFFLREYRYIYIYIYGSGSLWPVLFSMTKLL